MSVIKTKLGIVSLNNIQYRAVLHWDRDITAASAKKALAVIKKQLIEAQRIKPNLEMVSLSDKKVTAADGSAIETRNSFISKLKPIALQIPKPQLQHNRPIDDPKHGKTTISWDPARHFLEGVFSPVRKTQKEVVSRSQFIRDHVQELYSLRGKSYDPRNKKVKETLQGTSLSLDPRDDLRQKYEPCEAIRHYYDKYQGPFSVTERFARNSSLKGLQFHEDGDPSDIRTVDRAINSSFHRVSDQVHLMRGFENEEGNYHCFLGRMDAQGPDSAKYTVYDTDPRITRRLKKAKTMIDFVFNALYHSDQVGIEKEGETFRLHVAVHALLHTQCKQGKLLTEEIELLNDLVALSRRGGLSIQDAKDTKTVHRVILDPIPVASVQFDAKSRVETILPAALSGESRARSISQEADAYLFSLVEKKLVQIQDPTQKTLLKNTQELLAEAAAGKYKPWEEVMIRIFLCKLLGIKMIFHCLSSLDRANVAGAIQVAMDQWLKGRGMKAIPKDEKGRFAIHHIVHEKIPGSDIAPFKESIASAFRRAEKVTELARDQGGFKYFRHIRQHPALADLLPERYLLDAAWYVKLGSLVGTALASIVWLLALILDAVTGNLHTSRFYHFRNLRAFYISKVVDETQLAIY
ncbi:MAG: hypothetical protein HY069_04015 [Chlamydiia bacterium]|nr:hypothetical protein [Chlamydiia bacterium]